MSINVVGAGAGQTVAAGPMSIRIMEDGRARWWPRRQALRTRSPIRRPSGLDPKEVAEVMARYATEVVHW